MVLHHKGTVSINKRTGKDIWTNLYDFPLIETTTELSEDEFLRSKQWKGFIGKNKFIIRSVSTPFKHILSHQKIYARFWELDCEKPLDKFLTKTVLIIKEKDIQKYAVPRLIENYMEKRKK